MKGWWKQRANVSETITQRKITLLATECATLTGEDETGVLARGPKLKLGNDEELMGKEISGSLGVSIS